MLSKKFGMTEYTFLLSSVDEYPECQDTSTIKCGSTNLLTVNDVPVLSNL